MRYSSLVVTIVLLAIGLGIAAVPAYAVTRSIASYGAVPNDAVDDRTAINNAIVASSSGDTVYFPTGTYRISGSVNGKSGVRLEGATGSVLLYVGSSANAMLALYAVSNTTVIGLTLDGNNSANATHGVAASDATNITLQNLTIRNLGNSGDSWTHGIIFDPAVTDSTITGNTISNIATGSVWGAGMRLGHGSSRNRVENNTISNTGRGGILCSDGSTDLVIRNNTVTGSGGEGLGIELWSLCHRGLVEDNRIDHWLSLDTSDYCGVRRNTVSDKSGVYKLAGLEAISQNCVFADNVVDGGAQIGISLSNWYPKEYVLWARNTIKYCGTWGAQLQGDSGGIRCQYFYQNKFLYTYNAYPPAMYSNQGHGFRFNENCHYVTLDSNEISNNSGDGIGPIPGTPISLDQMNFTNNTIKNNGNGSVWDGFGTDLEWSGNTVSDNRWNNQLVSRGFTNRKPTAAFTCPSGALPGQVLSFANTSSDLDGSIGHVLWDFGDGLPSTVTNPTHAYANVGTYVVTLVVWDNLGRGALATKTITVDNTPPTVVISDNHADAIVRDADTVVITATFTSANGINESIPPKITIANGGVTDAAMSKASNLVWSYSWNVPSTTTTPATVSITSTDTVGNANSPATGKTSYKIDNTPPTVVISGSHTDAIVRDADTVIVLATFTEANGINESIPPKITIANGGVTDAAMSRASNLVWSYSWNVPATTTTPATVSIRSTDVAGNANSLATGKTSYTIDNTPPAVVISGSHTDAIVRDADTVVVLATFTEANGINESIPPKITIANGGVTDAAMTRASNLVWSYSWNVPSTTATPATVSITATDVAGNANSPATGKVSYTIDNTLPTVLDVTSSLANGSYKAGLVVPVQVTFSESVTYTAGTGVAQLQLETGATDRQAIYVSGSPGSVLTFNYTVQVGDSSADLEYLSTSALTLTGTATIKDVAGNNATPTLPALQSANSLGGSKAIAIDTTAPSTTASPAGGVYNAPQDVTLAANETATIYYTTDGSVPTTSSSQYSDHILISGTKELRFFAVDTSGNAESVKIEGYSILGDNGSIAAAKLLGDSEAVALGDKDLYLKWTGADSFGYTEEPGRSAGIRVRGAVTAAQGQRVCLIGTMRKPADAEHYIQVTMMTANGPASVKPLGANNRAAGMSLMDGIYAAICGNVKPGSITGNSYVITDGSDEVGIRIVTQAAPTVSAGDFVMVNGALGLDGGRVLYEYVSDSP